MDETPCGRKVVSNRSQSELSRRFPREVFLERGLGLVGLFFGGYGLAKRHFHKWREIVIQPPAAKAVAEMPIAVRVGGEVLWKPDPPASYNATGTVEIASLGAITGAGAYLEEATWHPNSPRVTKTPSGDIFLTLNYYGDLSVGNGRIYKVVKWLPAGQAIDAANFIDIWDTADFAGAGYPDYGICAGLFSDRAGNVYFLNNCYPDAGVATYHTYVHKFSPPYNQTYTNANYGTGSGTVIVHETGVASGKWSTLFDQKRQWMWMSHWDHGNFDPLRVYDLDGNLVKTIALTNPVVGTELYGRASYTCLNQDRTGRILFGFTAESTEFLAQIQSYYSCGYVYSDDGGDTWYGPAGNQMSLPIVVDFTGAVNRTGFSLPLHDTNPANGDWLYGSDSGYASDADHRNWNLLGTIAINKGNVHAEYYSDGPCYGPDLHNPYTKANFTSGVTYRKWPTFDSNDGTPVQSYPGGGAGIYVQDVTFNSRLYYLTAGRGADLGKFLVFKCDNSDVGSPDWYQYAMSAVVPGTNPKLFFTNACPYVQSDGSLLAIATDPVNHIGYFCRVS